MTYREEVTSRTPCDARMPNIFLLALEKVPFLRIASMRDADEAGAAIELVDGDDIFDPR